MDKEIFRLRNLDFDDVATLEVALGVAPGTISLKDVPPDAIRKQHLFVTVGFFDAQVAESKKHSRLKSFKQFVAERGKGASR